MESEFEPAVRTEETPGALIVIVDIPGFRKENLKVQIENRRDLIISGERGVKEMEEMTKVGGKLEKIQRFRKVIGVPPNWNIDERITAKFRDQTLRVSLPLLHISDQQNQETIPASGKPVQSAQSKDERSSPVGKQDSMQEQSGVAQNDQRARYPEAIRRDDNKAKGSAAAEESKGLVEGNKTEASKLAQDFVHGEPPILKGAQAVSAEASARDQSQFIQSKPKEDEEESDDEEEESDDDEEEEADDDDEEESDDDEEEEADDDDEEEADEEAAAAEDEDKGEGDECRKPVQSAQSKDERSSPVGKQDSMQEQSGVAQNDQRARYPEAIRRDDNKAKGSAAAEESKGLVEGNKTEASKLAQDFVHGEPPLLKGAQAVSAEAGARDQSQFIQSKSKEDEEESDDEEEEADDDDEEEADEEAAAAEDEDKGEGDECSLPIPNDEFPEQQLRNPYCTRRSRLFTRCCIVL